MLPKLVNDLEYRVIKQRNTDQEHKIHFKNQFQQIIQNLIYKIQKITGEDLNPYTKSIILHMDMMQNLLHPNLARRLCNSPIFCDLQLLRSTRSKTHAFTRMMKRDRPHRLPFDGLGKSLSCSFFQRHSNCRAFRHICFMALETS